MSTEEYEPTQYERDILARAMERETFHVLTVRWNIICQHMVQLGWLTSSDVSAQPDYAITGAGREVARQLGIEKGGGR